jgi:hypothetical protein
MLSSAQQPLNPWASMWTQPRNTVRQLMLEGEDGRVLLLAGLAGVAQVLERAAGRNMGDAVPLSNILLAAILMGVPAGLGGLYFWSWLTARIGRWLGGAADADALRVPIAWGTLPAAAGVAVWVVAILLLGPDLFTAQTPRIEANPLLGFIVASLMLAVVILGIWSAVLLSHSVAQAQGYVSAWRGFGNLVLGGIVLIAVAILVVIGMMAVVRGLIS